MSDPSHSHNYGTRIRNNSILKPSARLRHTPPPRRIKPARHPSQPPSNHVHYPLFPLPNVMLHPEDAASKVFHAIGRCFLSVDNRAMTIKDLAEMTLKFGLVCQNVSAASQAITTYIRNHLSRCEAQQDHPLLLRHTLSGTPADDDLLPALHSRVGGAPLQRQPPSSIDSTLNIPTGRHTNFRRGTIVWYLSKASGVSCPFTRAGILLSNYSSTSSSNPKPRIREKCGEKRKRLITRHSRGAERQSPSPAPSSSPVDSGYAESPSASSEEEEEEEEEEDGEEDEQRERPPKVKLTLRLRASPPATNPNDIIDLSNDTSSSEDEQDVHMSSPEVNTEPFCLPPYPRRSIAVPCYTPVSPPTRTSLQYVFPQPPMEPSRGSASPPPDSDHEDEGDFDFSSDEEESRPLSASVKVEDMDEGEMPRGAGVKEKNVRDMLDAWEDLDLDHARSYSCIESCAFVLREHEKQHAPQVKVEELEMWEWEFESAWGGVEEVEVKKEDSAESLLSSSALSLSPIHALPSSPWTPSSCSSTGGFSPPISYSTSVFSATTHASDPQFTWTPTHTRKPSLERKNSVLNWQDAELLGPDSVHIAELELEWAGRRRFASPALVSVSENVASPHSSSSDDAEMADSEPLPEHKEQEEVVVVHTCVPCNPPVSATQVEGIPVYQTTLPHAQTTRVLLRRLDTDFVNLTPLLAAFSPTAFPPTSPPFCPSVVVVDHPNTSVSGTWAPLSIARELLAHVPCPDSALRASVEVFLSDELVMRFPSALRDFWRVSKPGRMLGQFGVCFEGGVIKPTGVSRSVLDRASTFTISSPPPPPPPTMPIQSMSSPVPSLSSLSSSSSSFPLSSSRSESHAPSFESHPSTSALSSRLTTSSSPLSLPRALTSHDKGKDKHHQEDVWILCEEPMAEPESVLPAFDMALAELATGLGPNLGVLNMNMNMNAPCLPGESGDAESPLSPTEAEMFRVLCVCPDWEEKEEEEEEEEECGSPNPLSMCDVAVPSECDKDDTDADADVDVDIDVDVDVEVVEEEPRSLKDGRSLRRSKRVADAAARSRRTRGPRHA